MVSVRAHRALRGAQIALVVAIIIYTLVEMSLNGMFLAREHLRYISGIHWYSITFFMIMFLSYMLKDRLTLLYLPLVGVVYYAIHEAFFNISFLPYHQLKSPPNVELFWYVEIAVSAVVTIVALGVFAIYRERMIRHGRYRFAAAALWAAFILLNLVWITQGFPVTTNVYDLRHFSHTNVNPTANDFEILYNTLFTSAFFFTFRFRLWRSSRRERSGELRAPAIPEPLPEIKKKGSELPVDQGTASFFHEPSDQK